MMVIYELFHSILKIVQALNVLISNDVSIYEFCEIYHYLDLYLSWGQYTYSLCLCFYMIYIIKNSLKGKIRLYSIHIIAFIV